MDFIFGGFPALFDDVVVADVDGDDLGWVFVKELDLLGEKIVKCKARDAGVLEVEFVWEFGYFLEHGKEFCRAKLEVSSP